MEYKHLVCVTGVNNNKYYDMREMGDGTFEATYGRIGVTATILNDLANKKYTIKGFNEKLIELFTVIPRRMGDVHDYLAAKRDDFEKIIHREQELLDVMAGQVTDNETMTQEVGDESITVLDAFGLEISPATDEDIAVIKKQLGKECENLFSRAWRVENKASREKFKAFTKGKGRITKKLFWHGSRTENWWSILRTSLVLRPTNAVINGKMFGYGLYFAPRARKSVGYTSLHGSYWAGGNSSRGYMALYEVVYGKPYDVSDNSGCRDMTYDKLQKVAPGCSCLHAHAGRVLRNDEVIVYREDQVTIKYLVELKD